MDKTEEIFLRAFYPEWFKFRRNPPFTAEDIIRIFEHNLKIVHREKVIKYFLEEYCLKEEFRPISDPLPTDPLLPSPLSPIIYTPILPAPILVPQLPPPVLQLMPPLMIPVFIYELLPPWIKDLLEVPEAQAAEVIYEVIYVPRETIPANIPMIIRNLHVENAEQREMIAELEWEVANRDVLLSLKTSEDEELIKKAKKVLREAEDILAQILDFYAQEKKWMEYKDKLEELWPSGEDWVPKWTIPYKDVLKEPAIDEMDLPPGLSDVTIEDYEMEEWLVEGKWTINITSIYWNGRWWDMWNLDDYLLLPENVRVYVINLKHYLEETYYE